MQVSLHPRPVRLNGAEGVVDWETGWSSLAVLRGQYTLYGQTKARRLLRVRHLSWIGAYGRWELWRALSLLLRQT
jgi:hypothetical protein